MNSNLRTGDTVLIIAGKEKGKQGKIIASNSETHRVTVAGINIVSKHRKPRSQTDKGGIKKEEAPIDVSNVQLICPACGKATRIGHLIDKQGNKHRMCKKCKATIDGEKRTKVVQKNTKVEPKQEAKEVKAQEVKEVKEATAKKAVESKAKAPKATKAPQKVQKAGVASKAKVDTATTKRKTPQAKSTAK